jgi:hypothetical protein
MVFARQDKQKRGIAKKTLMTIAPLESIPSHKAKKPAASSLDLLPALLAILVVAAGPMKRATSVPPDDR